MADIQWFQDFFTSGIRWVRDIAIAIPWFREFMVLAVWSVFFSTLIQGVTHIVAYAVLRNQDDQEDLGIVLKKRELSLGIKNLVRAIYDGLIMVAITWNTSFRNTDFLMAVFVALMITTWVAVFFAVRFVSELRQEGWGRVGMVALNE